ncbi:hypothetical protein EDB84DRAFT_1444733 [Lactarius hengduanensis]|nr:hypothetical protein EDB84DRAFT_1444733 [Lactarius hengduanensis]
MLFGDARFVRQEKRDVLGTFLFGDVTGCPLALSGLEGPAAHESRTTLGGSLQLPTGLTIYKTARPASCQVGRGGNPYNTGTHGAETGSPELLAAWRGLAAQGPRGQRGTLGGDGLQLPTGLTIYKTARPASCQAGRGGNPYNTGTHGAETGSPELLAAWRGLAAQGPMGQEARGGRWAEMTARPASCQAGRGGNPYNTGTHGAETGSPELLAAWRGLAAQEPMGQEAREGC